MLHPISFQIAGRIQLDDSGHSELGVPLAVSRRSDGVLAIADQSDRDIKLYDSAGRRVGVTGRAGTGPGEFASLTGAEAFGDSIAAFDFTRRLVTIFGPEGRPSRTLSLDPTPFAIQMVDDSLILGIRHPGQGGPLLVLYRMDGKVVSQFFERRAYFRNPRLRHLSAVFADAANGAVAATVFGDDSVFIFDYGGRLRGSARTPAEPPLPSFARLLEEAGGKPQGNDGLWFDHGARASMGLVMTRTGEILVQIAPYDTRVGTDLREGSEVGMLRLARDGLLPVGTAQVPGLLSGTWSPRGVTAIGYADSSRHRLVLHRLLMSE